MAFWIAVGIGFLVVLAALVLLARHARDVEDDSSYLREERQFTPYGKKFLDIMTFRRGDD